MPKALIFEITYVILIEGDPDNKELQMFDLGMMIFEHIFQLIVGVIDDKLKSSTLSFLEKRKIRSRVEDATAEIAESLVPFLQQEGISQEKQERLIETCIRELKPFTENPTELFRGSLDGQKIFESAYRNTEFPQVIIEDGLRDIYSLLFPRIATLLCKIPSAIKDWENEAWSENYRRFDDVVVQLKTLFAQVDELGSAVQKGADQTLNQLKRLLIQKVGLQLDITGLRADQPYSGKFDDFFVLPEIKRIAKEKTDKKLVSVIEPNDCFATFTSPGCLSIIIGAPGAGKSTWSKWLQRETLRADWGGVGISIEYRNLNADELPSTYDLIRQAAGKQLAEDLTSEKIRKWLISCSIVFILDGFDEVKPVDRNKFMDWVREISDFARGCPIIITSRPLTTDHLDVFGDRWQQWNIEPFDQTRIINYISKWYANSPLLTDSSREINSAELAQEWLGDPTIGPLTGNPLLLSTLLMVHHLDGKLPNGRANLYKRYVDGMLGLWDDRHKLSATNIQLSPDEKRKIIRGIALHLFLTEKEAIDENALVDWLNEFLPSVNVRASVSEILLILRERTGLIVGPGVYNFAHKTIAEFLVAETVLDGVQKDIDGRRIDRFTLLEHRDDDRWNVVIFLWAGIAPAIDVISFIEHSITDYKYSLAYGILFDQYDRISAENRKRMLTRIKSIQAFDVGGRGWGLPGWPIEHKSEYWVPAGRLRSLTDTKNHDSLAIEDLLLRAIADDTIEWNDFNTAKNDFGWLLFLLFSTTPKNHWDTVIESYRDWVGNKTSSKAIVKQIKETHHYDKGYDRGIEDTIHMSENEWGYLVASRGLGWYALNSGLDLLTLYDIFISRFPKFSGFASLVIMSIIYEIANEKTRLPKLQTLKYLDQGIAIILNGELEELDKKYLLGTQNWMFWADMFIKKEKIDLLDEFQESLLKMLSLGLLKHGETLDKLTNFITKIKAHRSQVLVIS